MASRTAPGGAGVSFTIVGDSYVDLFCFLDGSLPIMGGDSILNEPVQIYAGGSTINTATHLCMLLRSLSSQLLPLSISNLNLEPDNTQNTSTQNDDSGHGADSSTTCCVQNSARISVQTMLNPDDEYGQILLRHAKVHNFEIFNCSTSSITDPSLLKSTTIDDFKEKVVDEAGTTTNAKTTSTPHCVVMVANQDRSFMSHRGCATYFNGWNLQFDSLIHTDGPIHLHIAGFFCTPGFGDGSLRDQLLKVRKQRQSLFPHQPTLISLVTQFDVTQVWDGGLVHDIIPLLSLLIMNELEATNILKRRASKKSLDTQPHTSGFSTEEIITYFSELSNSTTFVVTQGVNGAIAFRNNVLIGRVGPLAVVDVIDPTGAGDAFTAGFIYGLWECLGKTCHTTATTNHIHDEDSSNSTNPDLCCSDDAVQHALLCGCTVGTAAVTIRGASVPASAELISALYDKIRASVGIESQ